MTKDIILCPHFFQRSTITVAKELLGKILHFKNHQLIITETEAYGGIEDPASHAARGPTPRSAIMFSHPGFAYVYLIYGMYHCLNVVTETNGVAGAVLIRGGKMLHSPYTHYDGPGKLCRFLDINLSHNGLDISGGTSWAYFTDQGTTPNYTETPRIGIKKAQDKLWRFVTN